MESWPLHCLRSCVGFRRQHRFVRCQGLPYAAFRRPRGRSYDQDKDWGKRRPNCVAMGDLELLGISVWRCKASDGLLCKYQCQCQMPISADLPCFLASRRGIKSKKPRLKNQTRCGVDAEQDKQSMRNQDSKYNLIKPNQAALRQYSPDVLMPHPPETGACCLPDLVMWLDQLQGEILLALIPLPLYLCRSTFPARQQLHHGIT
jgi:hypothetical protein